MKNVCNKPKESYLYENNLSQEKHSEAIHIADEKHLITETQSELCDMENSPDLL